VVKGTVSISLEDYHTLLEASADYKSKQINLNIAIKELQVFLSFICDHPDMEKHIKSFNEQSKTSVISFINGRAVIKLKDEEIKN